MALRDDQITREAKRRTEEEERRKKKAARSQMVAVPRGEVGSFTKAYQGYKFVEEGSPEARSAKNLGEFIETEAQRRFEAKGGAEMLRPRARTAEEESQAAREALAGRAEANRRAAATLPSPLEKDVTRTELELPGGGRVKFGSDTLRQMREFEAKAQEEKAAQQAKVAAAQEGMYRRWYDAAQKRYDEELASRGLVAPKTRAEEAEFNKARMEDFRAQSAAKVAAQNYEKRFREDLSLAKKAKSDARRSGNWSEYEKWLNKEREIAGKVAGADPRNVTQTRKFFEKQALDEARVLLEKRYEERRKRRSAQETASPEAGDFTPQSTDAPIGVGTESLSYEQRPQVAGAMDQPFGLVPPASIDRGVDFGAISPIAPDEEVKTSIQPPPPTSKKEKPSEPPRQLPFPSTTTTTRAEEIQEALPGIENVPMQEATLLYREFKAQAAALKPEVDRLYRVRFQPGNKEEYNRVKAEYDRLIKLSDQEAKKVNAQVFDAYEQNVILPSFDEGTQSAFLEAKTLNDRLKELKVSRGSSAAEREEAKKIKEKLKPLQDALEKQIDVLKAERKRIGIFSGNKKALNLIENKISTLKKQAR